MLKKSKCIKSKTFAIVLLIILSLLTQGMFLYVQGSAVKKLRVAIFPFNNLQSRTLDINILSILETELTRYKFIEIVPVKLVRKKIYEIEPAFLWTERKDLEDRGGILWGIEPKIIEEIKKKVSAEFSIYGDLTRFGNEWTIDVNIMKRGDSESRKSFSVSGLKDEEIPENLKEMAQEIAKWIRGESVVNEAEEYIRQFRGGIYTYPEVVKKIITLVKAFPESIPLRALLLELYLKEGEKYQEEIIKEGLKIIELFNPSRNDDIRYLLSINIDPFDVTAKIYEESKDWNSAIYLRNKALKLFPYKTVNHKKGLGRDYYFSALSLQKNGQRIKALEHYKRAIIYLPPSSEYSNYAKDGFDKLNNISNISQ